MPMLNRLKTSPKMILACTLLLFLVALLVLTRTAPPANVPQSPIVPAVDPNYESSLANAILDTAAIEDVPAWHVANDQAAVQGLGLRQRSLERRTSLIADRGTREAGRCFLAAIDWDYDEDGEIVYAFDRAKIQGIDPEKLKRWAAIALTVLQIVEPFVPPPYNLAVHAAVMLLKLYLADADPTPQRIFGDTY